LQQNRWVILPYVITSGVAAVVWSLLLFILPNLIVVAVIKLYFFYVMVMTFRFLGKGDNYMTNEGIDSPYPTIEKV
jgi:hypothetical protein